MCQYLFMEDWTVFESILPIKRILKRKFLAQISRYIYNNFDLAFCSIEESNLCLYLTYLIKC